ncbi:MAG: VCBS repeat-containing protein [Verrucomicrobia bacterium]|nr:VCBS repeat-containing protein [Verrucomicrobiota bacterium]
MNAQISPAPTQAVVAAAEDSSPTARLALGERQARIYCQMCHVWPAPDLLPKTTWQTQILPRMRVRLGFTPQAGEREPDPNLFAALKQVGMFPREPMISEAVWRQIAAYYLERAPEQPVPQDPRPEIRIGLKGFQVEFPKFREPVPTTTLVKISEATHQIYFGDEATRSLVTLDAHGELARSLNLGNIPVSLTEADQGLYVTDIGYLQPTDALGGDLLRLRPVGDTVQGRRILRNLPRSVDAKFADLNGDGRLDFALCEFGNNAGRFSWFENLGEDRYQEHVLLDKAGPIQCAVRDFNGDGFPDLAVLVAQALESLFIFVNDGHGNFTRHTVFQRPPVWGNAYFEPADFNGDGRPDLLVANGDNADEEFKPTLKRYHGIRIYINRGNLRFDEAYFFPLNGAYKAVARDFRGNGKLDIAAISYFPDYDNAPRESFVYLENRGNLRFAPSTFRECIAGRWITMDVGDLDGDGAPDIVLGSYSPGPTAEPGFLAQTWKQSGPSVLILHNTRLEAKRDAPSP